jgi:hypothetical protein
LLFRDVALQSNEFGHVRISGLTIHQGAWMALVGGTFAPRQGQACSNVQY